MNKKQIRDMFKNVIFKFILQIPSSNSTIYNRISKQITERINNSDDLEYVAFSLQIVDEIISQPFYITKAMELNIFQRIAYIFKIIDTEFEENKNKYKQEKNKITEHSEYLDYFHTTTQYRNKDIVDITRFL